MIKRNIGNGKLRNGCGSFDALIKLHCITLRFFIANENRKHIFKNKLVYKTHFSFHLNFVIIMKILRYLRNATNACS